MHRQSALPPRHCVLAPSKVPWPRRQAWLSPTELLGISGCGCVRWMQPCRGQGPEAGTLQPETPNARSTSGHNTDTRPKQSIKASFQKVELPGR